MANRRSKATKKRPVQTQLPFPALCQPHADKHYANSAKKPVTGCSTSIDNSSAARPAQQLYRPARPRSLQDCTEWLNGLSHPDMAENEPVQRLQSATTLLQESSSRKQRKKIQKLLDAWDVPQKAKGRKRPYDEVKAALVEKVLEEGHRLQMLQNTSPATALLPFQLSVKHFSIKHTALELILLQLCPAKAA